MLGSWSDLKWFQAEQRCPDCTNADRAELPGSDGPKIEKSLWTTMHIGVNITLYTTLLEPYECKYFLPGSMYWKYPVMHKENAGSLVSQRYCFIDEMFNHKLHFQKKRNTYSNVCFSLFNRLMQTKVD